MPYTIPDDYNETLVSVDDGWLIAVRADARTPGASSGSVRPPLSEEHADMFGLPADHEGRSKFLATVFVPEGDDDKRRYTDTKEEAVAFVVENA